MSEEKPRPPNYLARGRERLRALAAACGFADRHTQELERLRGYLLEWSNRQRDYHVGPKSVKGSVLASYYKSRGQAASELLDSDGFAMSVIDASIDDLLELPNGTLMRAALRVRYLNEGIAQDGALRIRVFRSGRLHGISLEDADRLADGAEKALIPLAKSRGLHL